MIANLLNKSGSWSGRAIAARIPPVHLALPACAGLLFFKGEGRSRRITPLRSALVAGSATLFFSGAALWSCYSIYEKFSYWGNHIRAGYLVASTLLPFAQGTPYGLFFNGARLLAAFGVRQVVQPIAAQFQQIALRTLFFEIGKQSAFLGLLTTCDTIALSELVLTQAEASYPRRSLTLLLACGWIASRILL